MAMHISKLVSTWPTEILHQSTWGVIQDVVVLTHSKVWQFALVWKRRNTTTRSSYWFVANLFGEQPTEPDLLDNVVEAGE